jgi:Spy/CpxP family protein refolding chaperone
MSKVINYAGVSRVNGELKFRTATSHARAQQLRKLGDTDVEMVILRGPALTTKSQAAKQLLAQNFSDDAEILALLTAVATDENPFAKPKARTVKVKAKGVKISKATAEADDVKLTPKQAAKIRAEFCERVREAYEAN